MGGAALARCDVCHSCGCSPGGEWDPTGRPTPAPVFASLFDGIDRNGDGFITRLEWADAFDHRDRSGEGKISRAEWMKLLGHAALFDALVANKSGSLSRDEWIAAFEVFDRNKDGVVSRSEWSAGNLKITDTTNVRYKMLPAADSVSTRYPSSGGSSKRIISAPSRPARSSNRSIMESCVQPCPSAHVLQVMAEDGWTMSKSSVDMRALMHAATQGCLEAGRRVLETKELKAGWQQMHCDQQGDTALHLAVRHGHLHFVGLLLKHKAALDSRNVQGLSPLHEAADKGLAEIVELLCEASADPRLGDLAGNEVPGLLAVRRHAEHQAAGGGGTQKGGPQYRERRLVCVEACLKAMQTWDPKEPAAASLVNYQGVTGLHIASAVSDLQVCKLLLSYHALVDAPDVLQRTTPLMHAVRAGASIAAVKLLLAANASLRLRDQHGGSALHYAVAAGDEVLYAVELLVAARADVDAVDGAGASPLAVAGLRGAPSAMRRLLTAGANPASCREVLHLVSDEKNAPDGKSCREILAACLPS